MDQYFTIERVIIDLFFFFVEKMLFGAAVDFFAAIPQVATGKIGIKDEPCLRGLELGPHKVCWALTPTFIVARLWNYKS